MLSLLRSAQQRRARGPLWGDGLIDRSLTTMWYPTDWDTVSADELVLIIPSLVSRTPPRDAAHGPALHIWQAMAARVESAVLAINSIVSDGGTGTSVLGRLKASGAIDVYLATTFADGTRTPERPLSDPTGFAFRHWTSKEVWEFELSVLACIDRMLCEALPPTPERTKALLDTFELPEALIASIHARFNGAYVFPQYDYAHEILTAGAWLGILMQGRPALMPVVVSEVLVAYLERQESALSPSAQAIADILSFHAALVGGAERLVKIAKKVQAKGYPLTVTGGRPVATTVETCRWNGLFAASLASRLTDAEVRNVSA